MNAWTDGLMDYWIDGLMDYPMAGLMGPASSHTNPLIQ